MRHCLTRSARPTLVLLLTISLTGCGVFTGNRQKEIDRNLANAREYRALGQDDQALAALSLAIDENPKLTEAYMQMGDIYHDKGEYQKAVERFQTAVVLEPNNFKARYNQGLMQQLLGDPQRAVLTYLKALAIQPESFEANREIASAYLQLGEPETALPYAELATKINPESQPAWSNLAATYSLLQDYPKAIDAYRTANELGELADPVLLGLADAHIRLGNYPRAINTLNSLIFSREGSEPTPGLATAHERLGYALFKMRRYEDALDHYTNALATDASDVAALNGTGASYMTLYIEGGRENEYQKHQAVEAWRRSVQVMPEQPRIVDLLVRYGRS
jgi:tetratricopeptide (TPR) repeat protein